ncbi:prolyl oligopeptidase family serine peptidase [Nonomuraea sp. NPDC050556]|uniref:S9 family peptidase n=1 Tax=Nonomuraea sp. NPDC050556 TaxID=3364369 RepID=UPI00378F8DD6
MSIPQQIARTRRFTLGVPGSITLSPDGRTAFFLRTKAGDDPVSCLWSMDVETGEERLLADPRVLLAGADEEVTPEERIRRERSRELASGIVAYAADDACEVLAFALSGELWTVRDGLIPTPGKVADPRPNPSGTHIAYVSDGALCVTGLGVLVAPDGDEVVYGLPGHVATESMGRSRGYWWSPDGTRLLVTRVDTSPVQRWWVSDPSDPAREPVSVPYPVVGTANADESLWIVGLDGSRTRVDTGDTEYLTAAGWDAHGPYAAVQTRDQRLVQTLAIDPETGKTQVLAEQRDDAWVTLVPGLPARTASGALVGTADLDDTRHLTIDGRAVTAPGLHVSSVLRVDGETVLFTASDDGLWAYDGDLTRAERVTVTSRAEAPELELRRELLTLGPRGLRAALFLPSWHREGKLPVLMDPYGGPAVRKVRETPGWVDYMSQWFAEQGFAVLVVDGRGTPDRGPAWERAIHLDIASPVLEDQVDGLHAAAELHPELDLSRVAIRGWSFGGFLATLAVLRRPDVFHAAIAGAPVTDQRLYDTHWRERHLGHPDEHPEAYDRCSPILEAANLTRPLLLIHGLSDDNVVPAHTLRLSAALLEAGRPHEVLPLTRSTHQVMTENMLLHQLDFLRRTVLSVG